MDRVAPGGRTATSSPRPRGAWALVLVATIALVVVVDAPWLDLTGRGGTPGAFSPGSWFTVPVPTDAPSHPRESDLLAYLREAEEHGGGYVRIAPAEWSIPIFHVDADDPERRIVPLAGFDPPEWQALRIPDRARPAPNADAELVLWDVERGLVSHLFGARVVRGQWEAKGGSIRYLSSNGLPGRVVGSDEQRNVGTSRGNNGLAFGIGFDDVEQGRVGHVVKLATGPETSTRHVWPMWGSDGDADDPDAPPQGLRLRVRPEVDLEALGLDGQELVIARGLQSHGLYVGDNGGRTSIKLEWRRPWDVDEDALDVLPFTPDLWQVLPEAWGQPPG